MILVSHSTAPGVLRQASPHSATYSVASAGPPTVI